MKLQVNNCKLGEQQVMTDFEVFLAGDAIITLPWSQVKEPVFLKLVEEMRGADVTIINLETVIHSFKGYTL